MKILLISILIVFVVMCGKEKSCENCIEKPAPIPPRTIPNELLARCSVYIEDESKVRMIYAEATSKDHPQTYRIFDSLIMDGRKLYDTVFRIEKYFDMSKFVIWDSFIYRTEVRMKFEREKYFNYTTLIY